MNSKLQIITILLLLGSRFSFGQSERYTISGYLKDKSNGDLLYGATIYVEETGNGSVSNLYGFYSITLPAGQYTFRISYIGYETKKMEVNLDRDQKLEIELGAESSLLNEVVVTAEEEEDPVRDIQMSVHHLNIKQVRELPSLFGEPDIIKNVQMQPGVVSVGEGTSGFYVRGGNSDQNLILLDEAPVYNPSHVFGLFSVFNADIIRDAQLYKGGIPARYGGRLSSMLDVRTREGNDRKFGMTGGIGLLASRLLVEGPIAKEKASYLISGRRSYLDLFLKMAGEENTVSFYDLNAKVSYKPNTNNRLYISGYFGRDNQNFEDGGFAWGNMTGTLRWNHLFSQRWFSNTTIVISEFDYELEFDDPTEGLIWNADQRELSLKQDMTWFPHPGMEVDFGYQGSYRSFSPGRIQPNGERSIFKDTELQQMHALEHGLYAGLRHDISPRLSMEYGLRYTIFQNIGEATIYEYAEGKPVERLDSTQYDSWENIITFHNLEPRFSARYLFSEGRSIKASYQRMVQNVHLMSNSTVSLPFNTWAPSSPYLEPQIADQVALGYFGMNRNRVFEYSAEAYYKKMQNLAEFADNANVFFNQDLPVEFRSGEGRSYGIELMVQKLTGDLTGFVNYTYSNTELTTPDVNQGLPYRANFDLRHNFNLVLQYQLNDRWTLGGNFKYISGRPLTLPVGRYEYDNYNVDYFSERNAYQLPDFHRMDVSAVLNPRKNRNRNFKSTWTFAIYNLYNRKNAFTIYTRTKQDDDGNIIGDGTEKEARMVYLFPIMPSVTWNFKF